MIVYIGHYVTYSFICLGSRCVFPAVPVNTGPSATVAQKTPLCSNNLKFRLYSLCCCRDTADDDNAVNKHNAEKVGGVFLL